jgi:hypothetical protein
MKKTVSTMLCALLTIAGIGVLTGSAEAATPRILGSFGYQGLKLGMSEPAAEATGLLTDREAGTKCDFYYFVPSEGSMPRSSGVFVSKTAGVVVIGATSKMRTPQEAWSGMSLADLRDAYPDLVQDSQQDWLYRAPAPGNPAADYLFVVTNNLVTDFALETTGFEC